MRLIPNAPSSILVNAQAAGNGFVRLGLSTGYGIRQHSFSALENKISEADEFRPR